MGWLENDEIRHCVLCPDTFGRYSLELEKHSVILPDGPCPERFVAIDFETATTSGFACQLGIVEVAYGKIVGEREYLFRPPGNNYDWACTKVNHLSAESTKDEKPFSFYWPEIKNLLAGRIIVAHNAAFDIHVLEKNMNHYKLGEIEIGGIICTYSELRQCDLYSACSFFGVELNYHHSAICDARATAQLLLEYSKKPGSLVIIPRVKEKRNSKISTEHRKPAQDADSASPIYGKRFVLTGEFDRWPDRDELAKILSGMGAFVSSGVSGKTDYLVTGHAPGASKIAKATEMKESGKPISIISENDIIAMIGQ